MHAATPRIGIQTTIFSEHEVFEDSHICTLKLCMVRFHVL